MRKFLLVMILIILFILILILFAKAVEFHIPASTTVNSIYNLDLEIKVLTESIYVGDNVSGLVELEKKDLTAISEKIEVELNYEIIKGRKVVETGFAGLIDITDYASKTIKIPVLIEEPGGYVLRIKASHPQAYSDEDEDRFIINKKRFSRFLFSYIFWR